MNKISITDENGEVLELFVVEQARVNATDYILVTESEDDEAQAYILKDISGKESTEAVYEFVDDDNELEAIGKVFSELLEDTDIV